MLAFSVSDATFFMLSLILIESGWSSIIPPNPQRIKISFTLYQKNLEIFENDDSTQYNCYAKVAKLVEEYCTSRSFKLVEYLCFQLHKLIKANISQDTFVSIEVQKGNLSYKGLKFNARAEYSDL